MIIQLDLNTTQVNFLKFSLVEIETQQVDSPNITLFKEVITRYDWDDLVKKVSRIKTKPSLRNRPTPPTEADLQRELTRIENDLDLPEGTISEKPGN